MVEVLAHDLPIGLRRIIAERREQLELHGWTPEHDDQHGDGGLLAAASCYLALAQQQHAGAVQAHLVHASPRGWPWDDAWWRPSEDPRKNLMKAGALIAADLDRLYRKEHRNG